MDDMTLEHRKALLRSYFLTNGMLLCNESRELPYLESAGGDWNSIIALIEEGDVFYSKLYKGRVTYLSREFYANMKPYRQRLERLSPTARLIYDCLTQMDMATTEEIKSMLFLSGKTFTQCMDELFKELLVTAVRRDRTMNVNWSSFCWATFEQWEAMHPIGNCDLSMEALQRLTRELLTEKKLLNLLK